MEFGAFRKEWLSEMFTNKGETLLNLSNNNPVLLVFLRHFGCIFCKEALIDISKSKADIEAGGISIVFVHMTDFETADK
ncbi:MAG: AhpC/TSA family protein, partial [Bacteroidota bacterium]